MNSLTFDPASHTYVLNGAALPSVTTICRFLCYDYRSDRPWLAEIAARRGTAVHEACTLLDYGEEPEEAPEIAGYLTAYRRFLRDERPDWTAIERPIGSLSLGFAGTPDRCGILGGKRAIVDIKTGSALRRPALSAQLNGYHLLCMEHGFAAERLYGLRLDRSGIYELVSVEIDKLLFSACYILHNATTTTKKGK